MFDGLAALALLLWAGAAQGQACASRAEVKARLDGRYGEAPVGIGVTSAGSIIEIWTTADGSTWTVAVTNPQGTTCLISSGTAWETVRHQLKGKRS